MPIIIPQRKILPTKQIADTRVTMPMDTFNGQFAAGQNLANSVKQVAGFIGDTVSKTIVAQGEEEFTQAKLDYETEFRTFQAGLGQDTDYAGYTKKFNNWHDNYTVGRAKLINHRGAQSRAKAQFDLNRAVRGRTVDTNAQNALVRQTRAAIPNKIESFVDEYLAAETPETQHKSVAERHGYFQTLTQTGVLNPDEAIAIEKDFRKALAKKVVQNTVTAIALEEGWEKAIAWGGDNQNIKELAEDFDIELSDITAALTPIMQLAKVNRASGIIELNKQQDTDRESLRGLLNSDSSVGYNDAINGSSLIPEERLVWDNRFAKKANHIIDTKQQTEEDRLGNIINARKKSDYASLVTASSLPATKKAELIAANETALKESTHIITDEQVRGDLEEMANDIAIGATTKAQVTDAADKARYDEETIDDAAYKQIVKLVDSEFTSYQATAMGEAISYGGGQLITVTHSVIDDLLKMQAAGQEVNIERAANKRQSELWNLSQYRKAMNDWLAVHPESNSSEIYTESRKLLVHYKRSLAEVEKARTGFEEQFIAEPTKEKAIEGVNVVFKKPVRVMSPEGVTGWSSEKGYNEKLKDLGFIKISDANNTK